MKPRYPQQQYPADEAERRQKAEANRAMFDGVARRYDLLNRLLSLGLDQRWRRKLVDFCEIGPGRRCLDLCCGTGDVTRELARRGAEAVGLDASREMLAVARARGGERVSYVQADALCLPFPAATFDAITIAFGNRNVANLERLYAEMRRVARAGGRVASLEISSPASPLPRALFFLYFAHVPPLAARLLGADPSAYVYLPDSVRRYPSAEQVAEIMRQAGLRDVSFQSHMAGAIVIHLGVA